MTRHRRYRLLSRLALTMFAIGLIGTGWQVASWLSPAVSGGGPLTLGPASTPIPKAGDIIATENVQTWTAQQAAAISRQTHGGRAPQVSTAITKITFRYRSQTPQGDWITVYGRAYLPASPASSLPVYGFAPGTTGIGDQCAASLEQPAKVNWANYDSHMVTYASQGYAVVTTDYEGMRDTSRIHHYMVGELEGRALIDAVRALRHLPQSAGRLRASDVFVGGYSQGGHAALWADKIASRYAPELTIKGVIGYGPVVSVASTLADVTRGANINWFGPYVLYSYRDYYQTAFPMNEIFVPKVANTLDTDVPAHCINTNIAFWGSSPAGVFTPQFLQVLASGVFAGTPYAELGKQLEANAVGNNPTASAKRINTGALDNVVLPSQQITGAAQLCASSLGAVALQVYPSATHYDTMAQSLADTLAWMRSVDSGQQVPSTCNSLQ